MVCEIDYWCVLLGGVILLLVLLFFGGMVGVFSCLCVLLKWEEGI